MKQCNRQIAKPVNRHTGGLEKYLKISIALEVVNRHTGGLEINQMFKLFLQFVNRHTGGLENLA